MSKLPLFKCRSSQLGKICGVKGLGDTGRGYAIDYVKSHLYGFSRTFTSKYTAKGNRCEDDAIQLVSDAYDLGFLVKNVEYKENAFITGTCDILTAKIIHDVKNSWWAYTFPLFEDLKNRDYVLQAQGYMWLWDKEEYQLHYCLVDAPDDIIDGEYWKAHKNEGLAQDAEVDSDLYAYVKSTMTYSHLPDHLRLKTYNIKRDEADIKLAQTRVIEVREFINTLK